jgi:hypothetical protein
MKKVTLILAIIGMIMLQSCTTTNSTAAPINTINSEVFEFSNVNFLPNSYSQLITFPHALYTADMILVYRLSGVTTQGTDIWKLQPETYYFNDGTLDFRYDYDFTRYDVNLYMEGYNLSTVTAPYRLNQVFRVLTIPANFGKQNKMNFTDYNAVANALQLDESKVIKIKEQN